MSGRICQEEEEVSILEKCPHEKKVKNGKVLRQDQST